MADKATRAPQELEPSAGSMLKANLLMETAQKQRATALVVLFAICALLVIIAGILLLKP